MPDTTTGVRWDLYFKKKKINVFVYVCNFVWAATYSTISVGFPLSGRLITSAAFKPNGVS